MTRLMKDGAKPKPKKRSQSLDLAVPESIDKDISERLHSSVRVDVAEASNKNDSDRCPIPKQSAAKKSSAKSRGRFPDGNRRSVDLGEINLALGQDINGHGTPTIEKINTFGPTSAPMNPSIAGTAMQRQQSQVGLNQQAQAQATNAASTPQANGIGPAAAMNGMGAMPMHAGQQMDLNFIYAKVVELSEQLRENREKTQGLIAGAEQLAARAATSGANPSIHEANSEIASARIADLTRKLSDAEVTKQVLFREQRENGKLIGEYEQALEKVVGMLRDFAYNKEAEKIALAKQYLETLQQERDEHLKTRFERDAANAEVLKLMGQIRHAYHLAVEESIPDLTIVAGLQNEVRTYRAALSMPKEKFEDEFGYPILKHVKNGAGEPLDKQ